MGKFGSKYLKTVYLCGSHACCLATLLQLRKTALIWQNMGNSKESCIKMNSARTLTCVPSMQFGTQVSVRKQRPLRPIKKLPHDVIYGQPTELSEFGTFFAKARMSFSYVELRESHAVTKSRRLTKYEALQSARAAPLLLKRVMILQKKSQSPGFFPTSRLCLGFCTYRRSEGKMFFAFFFF